jgi:hypothetical protein
MSKTFVFRLSVLVCALLALSACDVLFGLEPVPTIVPTLPPLTPTYTPSPTPVKTLGTLMGRVWRDSCPPGAETAPAPTPACVDSGFGQFQGNGVIDPGEPGIAGVKVRLAAGVCPGVRLAEAVTGADGAYRFDDVNPGTYCLSVDPAESTVLAAGGWTVPEVEDIRGVATLPAAAAAGAETRELNFGWDDRLVPSPTPTATPTITRTPTISPTPSRTGTNTRVPPPTLTRTRTTTATATVTRTPTVTLTRTVTQTPTVTRTLTPSATVVAVRGVAVGPASASKPGNPGSAVIYTLTVTNTGNVADSFSVSVTGDYSPSANPTVINSLAASASATVNITANIPANALAGASGVQNVRVTSQGDATKFADAVVTTTVNPVAGVSVTTPTNAMTGTANSIVTYSLTLTNTGNVTDSYTITVTSTQNWVVVTTPSSPIMNVSPGGVVSVIVQITVPPGVAAVTDVTTLTFTSWFSPVVTASLSLTTTIP